MKENIKAFFGLWFVFFIILLWFQGGGRNLYVANSKIPFAGTVLLSFVINVIFCGGAAVYNKLKK